MIRDNLRKSGVQEFTLKAFGERAQVRVFHEGYRALHRI